MCNAEGFILRKSQPSAERLAFLDWEMGAFFHFGIRTFYEGRRDWDGKPMPLEGFAPTELDCEQWIATIKEAGAKYAILVCKHHDGFANWPSKHSEYHVGLTPWRNGRGDVVAEFVSACRKYDIKIGLYYSPAEIGYGDRSAKEHDDYFIAQVSELLSGYGQIDYLWFDGCGSEGHEYDKERIVKAIRGLQPNILIFNMWDPDTRWVGNEAGIAGVENSDWVSELDFSVMTSRKDALDGKEFLPAECDFMMRDHNWFYSEYDVHTVKSVEELVGLYYYSVGNGANFLINIGPDRRGLLPNVDAIRLKEFGAEIRRRFQNPLPSSLVESENGAAIELSEQRLVNHIVIGEDMETGGRVSEFSILVKSRLIYRPKVIYAGKAIGHKRIIQFPPIRAKSLIVRVDQSSGGYKLIKPEAYYI
jgi:alpha-L-fucosidase